MEITLNAILAVLMSMFFIVAFVGSSISIIFIIDCIVDCFSEVAKCKDNENLKTNSYTYDCDKTHCEKYKSFLTSDCVWKLFEIEGKDMFIT